MSNASLIFRKCISVFLFAVFALSITPVALLHDVFANHTDICYHNFKSNNKEISKADINCHYLFFVAEAQFMSTQHPFVFDAIRDLKISPLPFFTQHFYSQHHFYSELRGPPFVS